MPRARVTDKWHTSLIGNSGRIVEGIVCPKCGLRVVYNGNYFCVEFGYDSKAYGHQGGRCTWALAHPSTTAKDKAICDALGIDYGLGGTMARQPSELEKHYRSVECSKCGASPGNACTTTTGARTATSHYTRQATADFYKTAEEAKASRPAGRKPRETEIVGPPDWSEPAAVPIDLQVDEAVAQGRQAIKEARKLGRVVVREAEARLKAELTSQDYTEYALHIAFGMMGKEAFLRKVAELFVKHEVQL